MTAISSPVVPTGAAGGALERTNGRAGLAGRVDGYAGSHCAEPSRAEPSGAEPGRASYWAIGTDRTGLWGRGGRVGEGGGASNVRHSDVPTVRAAIKDTIVATATLSLRPAVATASIAAATASAVSHCSESVFPLTRPAAVAVSAAALARLRAVAVAVAVVAA